MSAAQSSFNFSVPRSRTTDPPSSGRAVEALDRSGTLRGQRKIALSLVCKFPGRSSKQLAALGQVDRHMLGRRMKELWMLGHIVRVEDSIRKTDLKWYAVLTA